MKLRIREYVHIYNILKEEEVKKAHPACGDVQAQVHFQSSGMAEIHFLINISQNSNNQT